MKKINEQKLSNITAETQFRQTGHLKEERSEETKTQIDMKLIKIDGLNRTDSN
jgi:hypothetical protein